MHEGYRQELALVKVFDRTWILLRRIEFVRRQTNVEPGTKGDNPGFLTETIRFTRTPGRRICRLRSYSWSGYPMVYI